MNTDPWTMRVAAPVPDPQPLSIRQAELLFAEGRACHAARWALNAHLQKWTLETRQALDRAIEQAAEAHAARVAASQKIPT